MVAADKAGFAVQLTNFDGPFDLLLQLITHHELDVTEISLSLVTAEFIKYISTLEADGQLEQASSFLVVAATLLDMKVTSLLPSGEAVDAEDIAALEARDLLFARLLQYKAFKDSTIWFSSRLDGESNRISRRATILRDFRPAQRDLNWHTSAEDLSVLVQLAFAPKAPDLVGLAHLHAPAVSIREQTALMVAKLKVSGKASFSDLIADASERGEIVARFLGLLELYRESAITFDQLEPLGPLYITWSAENWHEEQLVALGADYDN